MGKAVSKECGWCTDGRTISSLPRHGEPGMARIMYATPVSPLVELTPKIGEGLYQIRGPNSGFSHDVGMGCISFGRQSR